jgi:hypothetical protein
MKQTVASSSRISSLPQHSEPNASVNNYLVGAQLDEAIASGQDVSISWPFADGDVRDWIQAEAIWYGEVLITPSLRSHKLEGNTSYSTNCSAGVFKMNHR